VFAAFWAAQRGAAFTDPQAYSLNLAFPMLSRLQSEKNVCFMKENICLSSIQEWQKF